MHVERAIRCGFAQHGRTCRGAARSFPLYAFTSKWRGPWVTQENHVAEMRLQCGRVRCDEIAKRRQCVRRHEVATPCVGIAPRRMRAAGYAWPCWRGVGYLTRDAFEDTVHFDAYN